jgi:hypothetical protein
MLAAASQAHTTALLSSTHRLQESSQLSVPHVRGPVLQGTAIAAAAGAATQQVSPGAAEAGADRLVRQIDSSSWQLCAYAVVTDRRCVRLQLLCQISAVSD